MTSFTANRIGGSPNLASLGRAASVTTVCTRCNSALASAACRSAPRVRAVQLTQTAPPKRSTPPAPGVHTTPQPQPTRDIPPQPYQYKRSELVEPDWKRLPLWRHVSPDEWRSATWQRAHTVRTLPQLRAVYGNLLPEEFYEDLARDQREHATMALLLPPQMINTMVPHGVPTAQQMRLDPVRRYMLPLASDRDPLNPSHPKAERDSLHEADMWAVEGLTHRYPTKVLAEMTATCPQYCGHCTRMDLVGNSVPQVEKVRFETKPSTRHEAMLDYLRRTPTVRDVVVSGGDVANVPIAALECFVDELLTIDSVRDIRLASKAVCGLPQHWLQPDVQEAVARLARTARARGVALAVHTHVNAAQSVTPLVAEAARALLGAGLRDVRNQGVLLRGVCDTPSAVLDTCFALLDGAGVMPYYFYLPDMTPASEHWRMSVWEAQRVQRAIMGYLPGFATPRLVVDVPFVGKRWVDQADAYDRERGISYWSKNYRTRLDKSDADGLARYFAFYDPLYTLPETGQMWWTQQERQVQPSN